MEIVFDPLKNEQNIAKHGVSFERASECNWNEAIIYCDDRYDYGETRYIAFLPLHRRLHQLVFTVRGEAIRIISFRKANARERSLYDK